MNQEESMRVPFELHETELVLTRKFTYEEWEGFLRHLLGHTSLKGHRRWWLGDAINAGGYWVERPDWIYNYNWHFIDESADTARAIEPKRRRAMLSFDHHVAVQRLTPDQQTELLDMAESIGLTAEQLRERATEIEAENKRQAREQGRKHWCQARVNDPAAVPALLERLRSDGHLAVTPNPADIARLTDRVRAALADDSIPAGSLTELAATEAQREVAHWCQVRVEDVTTMPALIDRLLSEGHAVPGAVDIARLADGVRHAFAPEATRTDGRENAKTDIAVATDGM